MVARVKMGLLARGWRFVCVAVCLCEEHKILGGGVCVCVCVCECVCVFRGDSLRPQPPKIYP